MSVFYLIQLRTYLGTTLNLFYNNKLAKQYGNGNFHFPLGRIVLNFKFVSFSRRSVLQVNST